MPFRKHDPRRRAQANGVHLSTSSASLSSFSSSSDSSILPAAPPSGSSQSDLATPDQSVHTSPTSAHKSNLPPDTILPVPRSSSLVPAMGQIPSRSHPQQDVPPSSPIVPVAAGSAGSRLKRVFGGRRKKSEDMLSNIAPTLPPVPMAIEKSRSVMTPASSSPSAPRLLHQPTISAGPSYPTSPFVRHVPPERRSISSSNTSAEPPPTNPTLNPHSSDQEVVGRVIQRPKKRDSDHDVKDDWRKSDSTTTSYYTVRPRSVASGGTRTPRPVSMAESLHSTNTVVPAGKRLSALLTDAEFIMTEEDLSHSGATSLSRKTSPSGSSKTCKRHSISLSFTSPLPSTQASIPPSSSEGHSSRPGFKHRPSGETATLSKTAASGIIGPSHSDDSQSTGSHIKGNLAALTTPPPTTGAGPHQLPSSPSQHGSLRQTAISMTSGLAPAAGFAMGFGKRAVERIRAFGNLGSSHSSSGHSSSSSSITGTDDFGRNGSNLSLASHASQTQTQTNKGKPRRTPNAPSGAWSVNTVSSSSTGHTDPESFSFTGPSLGTRLRGPMRNSSGTPVVGGLVFGRDLKTCVDETAIDDIRLCPPTSDTVSPVLHERRLPALVIRCAQHLMKWGVEEEGLFRVSGRATHVAKLRSEFDTGADFDMLECAPSDLDPHAVASVFKTYLRELPEPILTHALNPYFEAAMLTETNARKSLEDQEAPVRKLGGKGPSLPSGPRDGPLRKAPSLSTLALPNFSGMRPPSQPLLNTFASLLSRLPRENRDLLRTVIDVISFVVQRKEIRMPLSNLTLVLCPTLNMSPPIFRVLCQAEGIWNGPPDDWVDDNTNLDVKGDTVDAPDCQLRDDGSEQDSPTESRPSLPQGAQSLASLAMEQAAGAWDALEERHVSVDGTQDDIDEEARPTLDDRASYPSVTDSRPSTPAWGKGSLLDSWSPPALTSSSDSLTTPSMSSEGPSIAQVTAPTPLDTNHNAKEKPLPAIIPDFIRTSPVPSSQPVTHPPVIFPRTETAPGTPSSSKHSSRLPSLSTLPLEPGSPSQRSKKMKRPSLTALFSKKSISSLRSSRLFSTSSSSSPYYDAQDSPCRSTPASPRTPGSISPSIISAPSLLPRRSSSSLPPLLNTQIDASSLSLAVGLEEDQQKEAKLTGSDACDDESGESSPIPRDTDAPMQPSSTSPITPVTTQFRDAPELAKLPMTQPEPLQPQLSDDSFVTVASAASYHRLSLWEEVTGDIALQGDWARDVLNDFGWSPTAVEHSMTGKA